MTADAMASTRIRKILADSSIYGAAIEDESRYPVETNQYWDIVYSKAIFRMSKRLEICGCPPVEYELREAPGRLREELLALYSKTRKLKPTQTVFKLTDRYVASGLFGPDALIASFASVHRLDALATVNRRHLKRSETVRKIARINRQFGLRSLRILLPSELIELLP